jgi:hypothetical protein
MALPTQDPTEFLQTEFQSLPLVEVLQKPPTALLGVSDATATALGASASKPFSISPCRAFLPRPRN